MGKVKPKSTPLDALDGRPQSTDIISDGGIMAMGPKDWAAIPDNPRQRDTVAHARRAAQTNLKEPHPTHLKVHMARLADGRCYKLDGHTRSYLWEIGKLEAPQAVQVQVWDVADLDAAKELYNTFDSTAA